MDFQEPSQLSMMNIEATMTLRLGSNGVRIVADIAAEFIPGLGVLGTLYFISVDFKNKMSRVVLQMIIETVVRNCMVVATLVLIEY